MTVIHDEELSREADDAFDVWDENWPSLEAFLTVETQWRFVAGLGFMRRTGIDYASLDIVLRRQKAKPHVFDDVRVMERAALALLDEVADRE